jgi:hypothetical protein
MMQAFVMMRIAPRMIAALVVVGITGCQGTTGDPRDDGFIGGVSGLTSGKYEQMVRDRRKELEEEEDTRQALEKKYAEKKSESDRTANQLSRTRAEIKRLDSE